MGRLAGLPQDQKEVLAGLVVQKLGAPIWTPNPGAQSEAYFSDADEVGYGGEAGGGKSFLLVGLALTAHKRSLILRRTNKEANGFVDEFTAATPILTSSGRRTSSGENGVQ